jgi:very-short-patch-repair endonuclease
MSLCVFDHLASARQLSLAGWTPAQIERELKAGNVRRLRHGTYGCAHLDGAIVTAASIGGALTCISVLRDAGVWAGYDSRTHVQVGPSSSIRNQAQICLHRERPRFGMESGWKVSRRQALWQAMRCLDDENAIAAMESAIRRKFLSEVEVRRLGVIAPRRLGFGIRHLVGDSGSGNETIVRLRLIRAGYRVDSQGRVPGLGHQDLIVEDCIAIEVDSKEWHSDEQILVDVERDLRSEGLGRHVIRIRPAQIQQNWRGTLAVIDRAVADAKRIRRR